MIRALAQEQKGAARPFFGALRARQLFFYLDLSRLRGGRQRGELALSAFRGRMKPSLSFESELLCPAGTGAFLYFSFGRLRGGRQKGAC